MSDVPCRVSSDLNRHLREQEKRELEAPKFSEYDAEIMRKILGSRFGPIVQALLEKLHAIEVVDGSFGVDKGRAFDELMPELRRLRDVCVDEWADQ